MPIRVRFLTSRHDMDGALWDLCFPAPHEGLGWYSLVEESGLSDQFDFLYGLIEERQSDDAEGKPVGIAPCFIFDVPLETVVPESLLPILAALGRFLPIGQGQKTLFIGSPFSDEGRVGLAPDADRRAAFAALQDAAEKEARDRGIQMIVWKDQPLETRDEMRWLQSRAGLFGLPSFPGSIIRFAGPEMADYLAQLKRSRRERLKKKLRNSARAADLDVEIVQHPDGVLIGQIFDLFWQTYIRSEVQFERLNRTFFEKAAEQANAHFIILREKTQHAPVAFMLCFINGERVINKFVGFDYARPREWLLYFRLSHAAVDWALACGAKELQSGQTCYRAKIDQGHALVPLYNYGRHANPVVHLIYRLVARTISWSTLDPELAEHLAAHPQAGAHERP